MLIINIFKFIFCVILSCVFFFNGYATSAHPVPFVIVEIYTIYSPEEVTIKYRLSIDPVMINEIYPIIDTDNDNKTSKDEVLQHWQNIIKPNLEFQFNDKTVELVYHDSFIINKSDFRTFNDYLEITLKNKTPLEIGSINKSYIKFSYKYLPSDPYGDMVYYGDNITDNPNIERTKDGQVLTSENNITYYQTEFKFKSNSTANSNTNTSKTIELNNLYKGLLNYFRNLDLSNPILSILGVIILTLAGALHGLLPGHGKTIITMILVNKKKKRIKDILFFTISMILSHTGLIYLIGVIIYLLNLHKHLNTISTQITIFAYSVFIILSLYYFYKAVHSYKLKKLNLIIITPNHVPQRKSRIRKIKKIKKQNKPLTNVKNISNNTLIAGVISGIIPCTDAIYIFILVLLSGKIDIAILAVLFFSIGMALIAFLMGLLTLYAEKKINLIQKMHSNAEYVFYLISGFFILLTSIINIIKLTN